jgi:PAS domain S-box-containing protein
MNDLSRYWRTVVDTMQDGLLVVDPEGTIVSMNKRAEALSGYKKDELLGKSCTTLKCTGCKVHGKGPGKTWCGLYSKGKMRSKRCQITNKAGNIVDIVKQASLLKDDSGKVIGAVETLTDISEITKKDHEITSLRRILRSEEGFHGILGKSEPMERLFHLIDNAARSDAPVAIYGESGTGKELVAKAIHELSPRGKKPFIKVNCAALNENLLESELFGHVKGAFTGAHRGRLGRFEAAHQGGLFLDEIGDVPLTTQVKLLRVLEEKEIERVGDHRPIQVDVRIITATNKDLDALVGEKAFRDDLFYRINVIPIHVAPLRDRPEDIPLLAHAFCERVSLKGSQPIKTISPEAMDRLLAYPWPGNVRELQSAIEYAHVLCQHNVIASKHLPHKVAAGGSSNATSVVPSDSFPVGLSEKELLVEALRRAHGNQSEAGRLLGVSRVTVWKRMKKYGVNIKKDLGPAAG